LRLPEVERAWIFDYADRTGQSRSGLITQAIRELRDRLGEAAEQGLPAETPSNEGAKGEAPPV
jgi:hypothetical protein